MILGITGTNGAGKGAIVEYLANEKGYARYSVRDLISEEVIKRGLPLDRTTLSSVGTAMRREYVPTYFVDTFLERAQERNESNIIIESIRTLAEAKRIQEKGGFIIGIDAPHTVRFARISGRGSVTDHVTLEEFVAQEAKEYTPEDPDDPTQMNVLGVLSIADYSIENDGSFDELRVKIEKMIDELSLRHHAAA